MALSCIIPIAQRDRANLALEKAGFGPDCFNVELETAGVVTHIGFHSWDETLQSAVEKLNIPTVVLEKRKGFSPKFDEIKASRGLNTKPDPVEIVKDVRQVKGVAN